jgi:eukaryotic-like serine/threonine-protein kinase
MGALNDPLVGRTIAQYEILARVGGGAMGVVYQARDSKLGRVVALKCLPQQWSHDESAKQRFVREAQAASATHHPNICTIHDIASADDGQLFIVMAFYEGMTLKQRLENGPLDIEEALEIATQLADGLAKAHAQGVTHRDVKPGNVMVTEDGVRILDFGLATFADALKLTAENSSFGTPAYMSPEQARGLAADARSDVWALGVVLYEMLAGHVPFQGSHAEAITHAVRHESPVPLRSIRPDVPEDVERLVFRALHKEPSVRFPSGRELARTLRQIRGLSVPMELRTGPVVTTGRRLGPRRRLRVWGAAAASLLFVAAVAWQFRPLDRVPVAILPVINQTGDPQLEPYRLALAYALAAELQESPNLRVLPYTRLLQLLRSTRAAGGDISSVDVVGALARHSGAKVIVVPTLLFDGHEYRARAQFRDVATGVSVAGLGDVETPAMPSAIAGDTAYRAIVALADAIQARFAEKLWARGVESRPSAARLRTLEAVQAFGMGLDAFDQLEYSAARDAFVRASQLDPRHPVAWAWLARVDQILREPSAASEAAERAGSLIIEDTSASDALFVRAVVAESRRDAETAEMRYRELSANGETWGLIELAGFEERAGRIEDAVATYQRALAIDPGLIQPDLNLCRLYNRLELSTRAAEHAERARQRYAAIAARSGEAQALLCLVDVLRSGDEAKRREAGRHAGEALTIFSALGLHFNEARAHHYLALTAEARGDLRSAAASWEKALTAASSSGNRGLEAAVQMNLGVTYQALGDRAQAIAHYEQSFKKNEELLDEREAARSLANAGALLIEYGTPPDRGVQHLQTALVVAQKLGDKTFEMFCRQQLGAHSRNAGDFDAAERLLNLALSVADAQRLDGDRARIRLDLAETRIERNDYGAALDLLETASKGSSDRTTAHARIRLAQVYTRLGDFDAAHAELDRAAANVETRDDRGLIPLLSFVRGELALESGREEDARRAFGEAAGQSLETLPDASAVGATAYAGWLDAVRGDVAGGRRKAEYALDVARRMKRPSLEALARVQMARIAERQRNAPEVIAALGPVESAPSRALPPELEAQARLVRSGALQRAGRDAAAQDERTQARRLVDGISQKVPQPFRARFERRTRMNEVLISR